MSSRANGCMVVILPKDKVKDFEGYFDAQNDYAFINTEIELAESGDSDIAGCERRVYDISCCYSLESCLIEPRDNNIRDVCYNLGLRYLDIDAENSIWSEQEFWKVHAQMDEKLYRYFFLFMYLMGTRKGEALALTWQDVDFERQEVRINKSLNRKKPEQGMEIILASNPTPSSMGWHILNGRSYEITTPKNITSNRKVWMTELVVKTLTDLRAESERDYDFAETDFVFGGKLPLSDQTVRRRMDQYADKAGIKRIRVHDLRHSHASLVISKGLKIEDLILLSKRLGHRDVKETLNTYSHLFPNAQRKILESIDEGAEM